MPHEIAPGVRSWASELDEATLEQAARTARLPILAGPIALMPDAHLGMGATIGSVIPTETRGHPVGGRRRHRLRHGRAPARPAAGPAPRRGLDGWVDRMRRARARRSGHWHGEASMEALEWLATTRCPTGSTSSGPLAARDAGLGEPLRRARLDQEGRVWILLHSGSRGGGTSSRACTRRSRAGCTRAWGPSSRTPSSRGCSGGPRSSTPTSATWVGPRPTRARTGGSCWWRATASSSTSSAGGAATDEVNCHHNYTELEELDGRMLWITRKGAIHAGVGSRGLIPGSMGSVRTWCEGWATTRRTGRARTAPVAG